MTGYQTGTGNRLTSDGTWTYSYDDEGNLTKKTKGINDETWTYSYDHRNQITRIEKRSTDGGTLVWQGDYKYDVFNQRIEQATGPGIGPLVTVRFSYDGPHVWADLDGSNQLVTRRLFLDGIDHVFARISAGGTAAWYSMDKLGSVRDVMSATGAVQDHLDYDGFGKLVSESNPSFGDRYKWTGREYDSDSGLQYNRTRYYDPSTARWVSEDPLGFHAGDASFYRYVGNEPTNWTDPSGLLQSPGQTVDLSKPPPDVDRPPLIPWRDWIGGPEPNTIRPIRPTRGPNRWYPVLPPLPGGPGVFIKPGGSGGRSGVTGLHIQGYITPGTPGQTPSPSPGGPTNPTPPGAPSGPLFPPSMQGPPPKYPSTGQIYKILQGLLSGLK